MLEPCTDPTHSNPPLPPVIPKPRTIVVDLLAPNFVTTPSAHEQISAVNHGILSVRESLAQRVKLRFDVEVSGTWNKQWAYKRLRNCSVLVSCPNAEQAELLIAAVQEFLASLNGKWLAPKPVESTANPSASETSK